MIEQVKAISTECANGLYLIPLARLQLLSIRQHSVGHFGRSDTFDAYYHSPAVFDDSPESRFSS